MSDTAPDHSFPLQAALGMEMGGDAHGATARLVAGEQHLNPNGVVHGAVLFAMADTAMGKATMDVIEPGCYCATIEIQLRFLRPAGPGPLLARATVLKPGRTIVHLEARVTDADDRLVALATGSFAVLRAG